MRRTVAIVIGTVLSTPCWAATTGDFDLYNGTPFEITAIQFSTPGDPRWHAISGDVIEPGGTDHITFEQELPCEEQLRVELSNGHSLSWPDGFNLCRTSRILIEPDANGGYSAHYR